MFIHSDVYFKSFVANYYVFRQECFIQRFTPEDFIQRRRKSGLYTVAQTLSISTLTF